MRRTKKREEWIKKWARKHSEIESKRERRKGGGRVGYWVQNYTGNTNATKILNGNST